jgi:radical SAM-linked protein
MGAVLLRVFHKGARFEAWNDFFRLDFWCQALEEEGLKLDELIAPRPLECSLPWDHIFSGVKKEYLLAEYQKALSGEPTPDCREAGCLGCGACAGDAKVSLASVMESSPIPVEAKVALNSDINKSSTPPTPKGLKPGLTKKPNPEFCYLMSFEKTGLSVFLGHLQQVEVFKRAFRRGGYKLSLSQGFHPSPRLSFLSALPLGVPSWDELLLFSLTEDLEPSAIKLSLPSGFKVLSLERLAKNKLKPTIAATLWKITTQEPLWSEVPLFPGAQVSYTNSKGLKKNYDLANFVAKIEVITPYELHLTIRSDPLGTPKPLPSARALWGLSEDIPLELQKLKSVLSALSPTTN